MEKQKGTYSTKSKCNALKKIQCSGLDGKPVFIHTLTDTLSPNNADGAIMRYIIDVESTEGINGCLKKMLEPTPGFFTLNMFDRGYLEYRRRALAAGLPPPTFFSYMDMIQRQSNNQSIYSYPNGGGQEYLNLTGLRVNPPHNLPATVLTEEMANAAKLFCTISRGVVEQSMTPDWRNKICGVRICGWPVFRSQPEFTHQKD